jgi:hypothetical protein
MSSPGGNRRSPVVGELGSNPNRTFHLVRVPRREAPGRSLRIFVDSISDHPERTAHPLVVIRRRRGR